MTDLGPLHDETDLLKKLEPGCVVQVASGSRHKEASYAVITSNPDGVFLTDYVRYYAAFLDKEGKIIGETKLYSNEILRVSSRNMILSIDQLHAVLHKMDTHGRKKSGWNDVSILGEK